MKKKSARKAVHKKRVSTRRDTQEYLVVVRSWMFLVAFALMLGMGAIVGSFVNSKMTEGTAQVAGYTTEAR